MDYEKKYKEALERARQLCAYPTSKPFISDLQALFPELKESDDGEIGKQIKMFIISHSRNESNNKIDSWLAWIEKQAKQKSTNWLQELEDKLANATPQQLAEWKEKYFKEESAEWSEEDEWMINSIIRELIHQYNEEIPQGTEDKIKWLKFLKDRYTWKPSKEHLHTLEAVISDYTKQGLNYTKGSLNELYEQLKKL